MVVALFEGILIVPWFDIFHHVARAPQENRVGQTRLANYPGPISAGMALKDGLNRRPGPMERVVLCVSSEIVRSVQCVW